jgi:uncharacterized protein (DUF2267 family)
LLISTIQDQITQPVEETMAIREETVLGQLLERAPFATASEARSALQATLRALRGGLTDDEAQALAQDIDAPWAAPLGEGCYEGDLTVEEFYRLVALHEQRRLSVGAEHAQIVCRVLGALLSAGALRRLSQHVPLLAREFKAAPAPQMIQCAEHLRSAAAPEHTLAAGRPGSSRPLSDARPDPGQTLSEGRAERAHAHSVARSDDPHGDTKLSSARGLTQEREGESLARSQRSVRR